jgi:hypothetical protein
MKKLVIALLLMPMIVVQAQYNGHKFRPAPGWLKTAAFYQIYPQSFKELILFTARAA